MANVAKFPSLSCGSITNILNQDVVVDHAILQIMGYKRVPGAGPTRFRLLLNDGETLFPFAILATQLNDMVESKKLEKFTIVKLTKYACTEIQPTKKIIICLEIESLLSGDLVKEQISSVSQKSVDQTTKLQGSGELSNSISKAKSIFLSKQSENHSFNSRHKEVNQVHSHSVCNQNESMVNSFDGINHSNVNGSSANAMKIFESPNLPSVSSNPLNVRPIDSTSNKNKDFRQSFNSAGSMSNSQVSVVPIINLTPYQNKWTIQGRVLYKTPLVHYNNQRSAGKLISFYLLDETGEIRATAFNEQAEQLNSYLEVGKVYYISNASVKPARENTPLKCDFEITVNENTKIELATDAANMPVMQFNFIPIIQIKSLPKDTYIDVIGICFSISEVRTIVCRGGGREVSKRDVVLIDQSKSPISLTLWGSDAEKFEANGHPPVIAVRNAKVTDFNGCSLSLSPGTMVFVNPEVLQASQLRSWFQREGDSLDDGNSSVSVPFGENQFWKTFADVASLDFEDSNRAEYFTVKACVTMIQKEKCMYQACPAPECFKKVVDLHNGLYKCAKCVRDYDSFVWTLLLTLDISDFSDNIWVVAFRDVAEKIIGMNSGDLSKLKMENEDKYYKVLTDVQFRCFIFKLRSKMEVYNETRQLRTTVLDAKPVDSVPFTRKLLSDIKRMEKILHHEESL